MTDLNKIYNGDLLWASESYEVRIAPDNVGYHIINVNTGAVEGFVDQEPAAVMSMLYLQDAYDEVMQDPEREYKVRKQRREATPQHIPKDKVKIVN